MAKPLLQQFAEKGMTVMSDFVKSAKFKSLSGETKEVVYCMLVDVLEHHSTLRGAVRTLESYKRLAVADSSVTPAGVAAIEYAHRFMLMQYAKKFFKCV